MLIALGLAVSAVGAAPAAVAAPSTQVVQGQYVRLVSTADWDTAQSLTADTPVRWDIAVSANAPEPGTLTVGVSAEGEASLVVDAVLCMSPWEGETCPGGPRALATDWLVPRDGKPRELVQFSASDEGNLRLTVSLDDDARGTTQLWVHADGAGDALSVGPGGDLAATGLSPLVPVTLGIGAALVILGGVLALTARTRSRAGDSR